MQDVEVEVLQDLKRHAMLLSKGKDPRRRIEASKWEIFFDEKLAEAERAQQEVAHREAA